MWVPTIQKRGRAFLLFWADGAVLRLGEIPLYDRVKVLRKEGLYSLAAKLNRCELETQKTFCYELY